MNDENAAGIQPIYAEKLRKYLISNNLFNSKYKAKKIDDLIFFPLIVEKEEIFEKLNDIFDGKITLKKVIFEEDNVIAAFSNKGSTFSIASLRFLTIYG